MLAKCPVGVRRKYLVHVWALLAGLDIISPQARLELLLVMAAHAGGRRTVRREEARTWLECVRSLGLRPGANVRRTLMDMAGPEVGRELMAEGPETAHWADWGEELGRLAELGDLRRLAELAELVAAGPLSCPPAKLSTTAEGHSAGPARP